MVVRDCAFRPWQQVAQRSPLQDIAVQLETTASRMNPSLSLRSSEVSTIVQRALFVLTFKLHRISDTAATVCTQL